jgi:hypothetical protein
MAGKRNNNNSAKVAAIVEMEFLHLVFYAKTVIHKYKAMRIV